MFHVQSESEIQHVQFSWWNSGTLYSQLNILNTESAISLNISNPEKNDVDPNCNNTENENCNNEGDSEVTTDGNGIFAIISTLAFVMFFAFGPGSIPWLITGELFTQGTIITYYYNT